MARGEGGETGRDSQKQNTPSESSTTARPTKTGPAAPVTLSPRRSRALKQRKTCLVQHRDIPAIRASEERSGEADSEDSKQGVVRRREGRALEVVRCVMLGEVGALQHPRLTAAKTKAGQNMAAFTSCVQQTRKEIRVDNQYRIHTSLRINCHS